MTARHHLPTSLGPAFRVARARATGVGESRLRAADLLRPFHGARQRAPSLRPLDALGPWEAERARLLDRIDAYLPLLPEGAFFAGPTAAAIHGAPLPRGIHAHLFVAVHHPRTAPHRPGVRGVQVLARMATVVTAGGYPVADAASTWAGLGGVLGRDDLVAVADYFLRVPRHPGGFRPPSRGPLAERAELEAALEAGRRRGAVMLREALGLARTGSSSRPETRARLVMIDAGLPEPALDVDVYGEHGEFLGCADLAYPHQQVAIEYEGEGHASVRQLHRDIEKYQAFTEAGWRVVRLTHRHVFEVPGEVVRRIRLALR